MGKFDGAGAHKDDADEHHPTANLDLDRGLTFDTGNPQWFPMSCRSICKSLRFFLSESLKSATKCPECGGILPDLCIAHRGRAYLFTCTKIEENGKVLAETDYARLSAHSVYHIWNSLDKENKEKLEPIVKKFLLEWNNVFNIVRKV